MIIHLIVELIKKTLHKMTRYFPEPYKSFGGNINVKVNLSNHTTTAEFKNATGVDTSKLAPKSDFARLKAEVDKIDVDKLKTIHVDLTKPSNVVKNEVDKKTVYDNKLVTKVNSIDTNRFVLKTKYITDKLDLGLVQKTDYTAKISEIESKICGISGLATNSALTAVENKITDVGSLGKKRDYNTKISEIEKKLIDHNHDKYITTSEFNRLTAEHFAARLAQSNLIT